jgi:hypothetical protein
MKFEDMFWLNSHQIFYEYSFQKSSIVKNRKIILAARLFLLVLVLLQWVLAVYNLSLKNKNLLDDVIFLT